MTTAILWRAPQVAAYLGVRVKRVYELGIPAIRISRRTLRWRPEDVYQWAHERRIDSQ